MEKIVLLKGNDIFTDSLVISRGTGVAHRKLKESISVIRQIKRCRFHQIKTGLSEHLTMG